ncbi:MAG: hypothetical protein ACOYCD_10420, partial [Kiritimatiellia bacterium]
RRGKLVINLVVAQDGAPARDAHDLQVFLELPRFEEAGTVGQHVGDAAGAGDIGLVGQGPLRETFVDRLAAKNIFIGDEINPVGRPVRGETMPDALVLQEGDGRAEVGGGNMPDGEIRRLPGAHQAQAGV